MTVGFYCFGLLMHTDCYMEHIKVLSTLFRMAFPKN